MAASVETVPLLASLCEVSFPTLGHFLEDGFCSPEIRSMVDGGRMVGSASTALVPDADAAAVNEGILRLLPGEVLVLDMGGDRIHAPVGAVTVAAARSRGAAGILVDGPVTDIAGLNSIVELDGATGAAPLPVFARGSTCLTTKRLASGRTRFGIPVSVGGVTVTPGDLVLADANGVVILAPEVAAAVVPQALESDRAEPTILRRIAKGEPLEDILFLG